MQTKRSDWTTFTVATALVGAIIAMVASAPPARGTALIYDPFELDTPNPAPRSATGYPPSNYTLYNLGSSPLANVTVENVGSPFNGGSSQSMLLYDQSADKSPLAYRAFASDAARPLAVAFDIRANQATVGTGFQFRVFNGGTPEQYLFLAGNGTGLTLKDFNTTLGTLSEGTWYHLELDLPVAGSSTTAYQIEVTPFGGSTTTYTGYRTSVGTGAYNNLQFDTWSSGNTGDFNIDNVEVSQVPEPAMIMLLGLGAGLLWLRRRQQR